VKTAVEKINQASSGKVSLGPSDRLTAELPAIRKLRDKVNSDTISFEINAGVPTVPITLNGGVQVHAVVDSGATWVTISDKLAKQLDLTPGPGDRKAHMMTADGTVSEVHVMVLKSIKLGKFTVEDVECIVVSSNGKQVHTLLGGSFLSRFVYQMNLGAGKLNLSQVVDKPTNDNTVINGKPSATTQPSTLTPPGVATQQPATPPTVANKPAIPQPRLGRKSVEVAVPGDHNRGNAVETGFTLKKGQSFTVVPNPEDRWSGGGTKHGKTCDFRGYPDRPNNWMKMYWKIGDSVELVDPDKKCVAPADGMLSLFAEDDKPRDNSGQIRATVTAEQR
jgi:aspartyl protease family protein